jgi:hypothetical protein
MKLHINSQDLQSFIITRLDLLKNVNSSEGVMEANPKLEVKLL